MPIAPPKAAPMAEHDACNFVFGLESIDREILEAGEIVQDVAGRGNRIGTEEQRAAGLDRRGDEAEGGRGIAGDVAIDARERCEPDLLRRTT